MMKHSALHHRRTATNSAQRPFPAGFYRTPASPPCSSSAAVPSLPGPRLPLAQPPSSSSIISGPGTGPGANPGAPRAAAPAEPDLAAARLDGARLTQVRSTELLSRLLEAPDPTSAARQEVASLSEEFFMAAGAYLALARKEGNAEVAGRLERAVSAAWAVKQSTLRPELQLLNSLVRAEGEAARREIYTSGGSDLVSTLTMNGGWFGSTLGRMLSDVERQPPHPDKQDLVARLRAISRETQALAAQAARQQARRAQAAAGEQQEGREEGQGQGQAR